MVPENINYAAMLADLKAKRSALDASISALEAALASGALGRPGEAARQAGESPLGSGGPIDLPVGAFLNKSIPAAIKMYLAAVKRKKTIPQIAAALKEYGTESMSENFEMVVRVTLGKLRHNGEVLRFKDGWALAEHYPEALRNRLTEGQRGKRGTAAAKNRRKKKSKIAVPAPDAAPKTAPAQAGNQASIEAYFSIRAGQEFSPQEVAAAMSARIQTVGLICAKLAHAGKLERTASGKFRMAKVQQIPKAG